MIGCCANKRKCLVLIGRRVRGGSITLSVELSGAWGVSAGQTVTKGGSAFHWACFVALSAQLRAILECQGVSIAPLGSFNELIETNTW